MIKKKRATSDATTGSTSGFHVGFLLGTTPSAIRLLGGNQSNMVRETSFLRRTWEIRGLRWPA